LAVVTLPLRSIHSCQSMPRRVNDAERLTRDPAMRAIVGGFLYVPW
jgi:hypothetical protein